MLAATNRNDFTQPETGSIGNGNVPHRTRMLRYGCAVLSTSLGLAVRLLLTPYLQTRFPYAFMYFAITLTAWYGGFGPALLAMALGYLGVAYFLIPPYHTFVFASSSDFIGFLLFVFLGLSNILFSESLRRAQSRSETSARQAREAADALRASEAQRVESEERLRMAADAAHMGVWSYSQLTDCLTLSPFGAQALGRSSAQMTLTRSDFLETVYAADRLYVSRAIRDVLENRALFDTEYRVVWPDKTIHWLAARGEVLPNAHTGNLLFSGVVQEITQRKQIEQEREASLAEIEALNRRLKLAMAETHHRVKNNLQVIAAMIDLQVMEGTPMLPREEFLRLSQHVRTLASIHEILTREAKEYGDAQTLSARALLKQLLSTLQQAHADRPLRQHIEEATLSTRQGTALALITNELVSNAVKHGKGVITIHFAVQENVAHLETCDDGAGFPADFDPNKAANTGLELIQTLTLADLTGRIAYSNRPEGGACVRITFPISTV